ncbi:MAG: 50S ribosomal protein L17 [Bacteroidetes bacterium]|nr:50S ribosomal protein L17 [Bacteroidota bacterium]
MRHAKKGYKLSRTASHRKATLSALSVALIQHKRITTTLTKAKALRTYVEPLITRSRVDTMVNRRQVFRRLMDKNAVTELFNEVSEKVGDRPGGYTRVLRLGQREGDAAEMAIIELVDYNDSTPEDARSSRRRTRRGRRRRGSDSRQQVEVSDTISDDSPVQEAADAESVAEVIEDEVTESDPVELDVQEMEVSKEGAEKLSTREPDSVIVEGNTDYNEVESDVLPPESGAPETGEEKQKPE